MRSAKDQHVLLMIQGSPLPHAAGAGCGWCDGVRDIDTNGPSAFARHPFLETIMQLDGRRPTVQDNPAPIGKDGANG